MKKQAQYTVIATRADIPEKRIPVNSLQILAETIGKLLKEQYNVTIENNVNNRLTIIS